MSLSKPSNKTGESFTFTRVFAENYCYQHTICFNTTKEALFHAIECNKLMAPYTCNCYSISGKLCDQKFKNGVLLYNHCLAVHKIHICNDCEFVGENLKELRHHKHIGVLGGRTSKYFAIYYNF